MNCESTNALSANARSTLRHNGRTRPGTSSDTPDISAAIVVTRKRLGSRNIPALNAGDLSRTEGTAAIHYERIASTRRI